MESFHIAVENDTGPLQKQQQQQKQPISSTNNYWVIIIHRNSTPRYKYISHSVDSNSVQPHGL